MSEILKKLNIEHYMGDVAYVPMIEWETLHGEMGLYRAIYGSYIAYEMLLLIIYVDEKLNIQPYPSRDPQIAIDDANHIAKFADATRILNGSE